MANPELGNGAMICIAALVFCRLLSLQVSVIAIVIIRQSSWVHQSAVTF